MFADIATAVRVERAEAQVMRVLVEPLVGSTRAPDSFARAVDAGVATYVRPASPLNKVIGVGITSSIDAVGLAGIEDALAARGEPVRVELCTLSAPETYDQLTARGYRLLGFEHVLARSLGGTPPPVPDPSIRVERVRASLAAFRSVVVEGTLTPDGTGVVVDHMSAETIVTVIEDALVARGVDRYVALRHDVVVGGASMCLQGDVAVLTGAATAHPHRGAGGHAALLEARLADAYASGATLACVTTAPGARSEANMARHGFSLLYARALLAREAHPTKHGDRVDRP